MSIIKTILALPFSKAGPLVSKLALLDKISKISPTTKINRFARIKNTTIDRYTYIGPNTRIDNADIGSFSSISWNCSIGLRSHPMTSISTSPLFSEIHNGTGTSWLTAEPAQQEIKRCIIGSDVWIGANAIILEGVEIGDGAIIGTGAIVTKDVAPYTIAAGVPARKIRARFDESTTQLLLSKQWWNAPEHEIRSMIPVFQLLNPSLDDISKIPQGTEK